MTLFAFVVWTWNLDDTSVEEKKLGPQVETYFDNLRCKFPTDSGPVFKVYIPDLDRLLHAGSLGNTDSTLLEAESGEGSTEKASLFYQCFVNEMIHQSLVRIMQQYPSF